MIKYILMASICLNSHAHLVKAPIKKLVKITQIKIFESNSIHGNAREDIANQINKFIRNHPSYMVKKLVVRPTTYRESLWYYGEVIYEQEIMI